MKYFVYILKTIDDTLYCGIAKDVIKRFNEHLTGLGAKYTKAHKPKEIVFVNIFDDKSLALKEEYRIKKTLTKKEKLLLIETYKCRTNKLLEEMNK